MTKQKTEIFYTYRYRSWDSNVYYGTRNRDFSAAELATGWGDWEYIDERKYNEILSYIEGSHPAHYEAQKIMCEIQEVTAFDPQQWIGQKFAAQRREEKHLNGRERKTIYLAKMREPDGSETPWLAITCREFEAHAFREQLTPDQLRKGGYPKFVKTVAAQEHFGSYWVNEYMYEGKPRQAFDFHADYAEMEA